MADEATEAERQAVAWGLAAIEARYGDRLDSAGRAVIEARLLEFVRLAAVVSRVPLTLGDEPVTGFVPRRAREGA